MRAKTIASIIAIFVLLISTTSPCFSAEEKNPLFVNLTTDETWAAGMAIHFAEKAIERGHKVTIFLNVSAVHLADISIIHGTHGPKNKTVQELISGIQKKGAQIIVCGGCMKKAGIMKNQLLDGVVVGNADVVFPAVFEGNTKVMSW